MKEDIIRDLKEEFRVFEYSSEYIEELVEKIINKGAKSTRYENAKKRVLSKIKKDWSNLNVDWFIRYLENNIIISDNREENIETLGHIIDFLNIYGLILDKDMIYFVTQESDVFDNLIQACFEDITITLDEINVIAPDKAIYDLLYNYAVNLGYIEDSREEIIKNTKEKYPNFYLEYLNSITIPSREEVTEWFKLLQLALENNDEKNIQLYRNKIVIGHLRFAISRIYNYLPFINIPLDDLVQIASLAIFYGIERFDYKRGSFTYFLNKVIISYLQFYYNYNRNIAVSIHTGRTLSSVSKIQYEYKKRNEELKLEDLARELNINVEQLNKILTMSQDAISLDVLDEHQEVELIIDEDIFYTFPKKMVNYWLDKISDGDARILRMRYGIQDVNNYKNIYEKAHSLNEIATIEGLSKNGVLLRERKAFSHLQSMLNTKGIISKEKWMFKDFFLAGQLKFLNYLIDNYLSFEEQYAIYTLGRDFEKAIYAYDSNKDIIFKAIAKLKTLFNTLDKFYFDGYSFDDLKTLFNCERDECYALIELLEKNPIFKKVYGAVGNVISREDLEKWCILVENKKLDIANIHKIKDKTLIDVLDCSYEELSSIKSKIYYQSIWLNLCRLYGDELDLKLNYDVLLVMGIESFYDIFGALRKILSEIRRDKESFSLVRRI